ncbi:Uncharacterised protein (plasmid) [Tsukamurella tyrosinosolvens]|uniref:Uncharacterized protein n=1 Tax=Tsukamurella tyrosinosolvens TaxID=57704 RepID=A0A1H4WJQ8_TSUTY|nr:hypothetical protein AXK58_24115 [Tsukamurella tyrosinosolvens]SEC93536.1 hypothetical protein SAMN04489793_3585 [Tsukamurella tyrosinosolvens]VEH89402.1 Uncharacterised protein [Tsukamurella tyrosinosolvens]
MHLTRTIVSLAAAGTLLTGCSTVVPGTAVPDPDAAAIKLDTGGLSTKPRTPTAPGSQRKVLAANMLSERTVIPSDIEAAYTDGGAQTAVTARNFISLESEDTDRIAKRGMLYGFMDTRSIAWLCQVDLAPVGRFHSAPPEWGPEPLESGVWMGGRGCAVWLRRLVGIASRCVRMPSS